MAEPRCFSNRSSSARERSSPTRRGLSGLLAAVALVLLGLAAWHGWPRTPQTTRSSGPAYEVVLVGPRANGSSRDAVVPTLAPGDEFSLRVISQAKRAKAGDVEFRLISDGRVVPWDPTFTRPVPGEVLIRGTVGTTIPDTPGLCTMEVRVDGQVAGRQAVLLR